MNLLFSCAGRRAYLLKYFRDALDEIGGGKIFATDMSLTAPALAFADVPLRVPAVYAENYLDVVETICRENKIDALISLNDLELPILSAARERFEKIGTRLIVSSPEVIDVCFDKLKTARFVESLGLNTPKTFVVLSDALLALECGELAFPLILKPRWGSGSIGIELVRDREELLETYEIVRRKVARSILAKASAPKEEILIQEAITDAEYGLDVMNDLGGNTIAVSVKRKLAMRAGETDKAVTVDKPEIREIGFAIGRALRHVANLDCDVLERAGKYYVLELNPRFGGGYPFSQEAGVNLPLAILKWLRNESVPAELLVAKPNVASAKCDILVSTPPPGRRLGLSIAFPAGFCRGNAYLNFGIQSCSAKKVAVRSRADKPKLPVFDSVNQQPVGTNVAFAKALPISGKRVVVKSFRKRFFLHKAHNRVLKKRGFQASLACEFQIALKSRAVNNFEHLLGLQIGKEFFDGFEAFRFIRSRILLNNHAVYFRHRGKCFVVRDFRAPEVRAKRKRAVVDALMQKQAHRFGHRDAEMREKLFRLRFDFGFNANTEGCGFCHDNVLRFDFFELSYNKKAIATRFSSKERLSA